MELLSYGSKIYQLDIFTGEIEEWEVVHHFGNLEDGNVIYCCKSDRVVDSIPHRSVNSQRYFTSKRLAKLAYALNEEKYK